MPALDAGLGVSRDDSRCIRLLPGAQNEVAQVKDRLAQSREAAGRNGGGDESRHLAIIGGGAGGGVAGSLAARGACGAEFCEHLLHDQHGIRARAADVEGEGVVVGGDRPVCEGAATPLECREFPQFGLDAGLDAEAHAQSAVGPGPVDQRTFGKCVPAPLPVSQVVLVQRARDRRAVGTSFHRFLQMVGRRWSVMMIRIQVGLKSKAQIPLPDDLLTIGEVARLSGRRASSIRYYEEIGLLPEPIRRSGQRRYDGAAVRKLAIIDMAQRAGLALDEIRALLDGTPGDDAAAVGHLRAVAGRKLPQVAAQIERAVLVQQWLQAAASCECPSLDECCLFDSASLPTAAC